MSTVALISLLNLRLFRAAAHIGVTICLIPLKSYRGEAASKTSRCEAPLQGERKAPLHSILHAKKRCFHFYIAGSNAKSLRGNGARYTANNAVHKINPLKPFYIFLDQKKEQ